MTRGVRFLFGTGKMHVLHLEIVRVGESISPYRRAIYLNPRFDQSLQLLESPTENSLG